MNIFPFYIEIMVNTIKFYIVFKALARLELIGSSLGLRFDRS